MPWHFRSRRWSATIGRSIRNWVCQRTARRAEDGKLGGTIWCFFFFLLVWYLDSFFLFLVLVDFFFWFLLVFWCLFVCLFCCDVTLFLEIPACLSTLPYKADLICRRCTFSTTMPINGLLAWRLCGVVRGKSGYGWNGEDKEGQRRKPLVFRSFYAFRSFYPWFGHSQDSWWWFGLGSFCMKTYVLDQVHGTDPLGDEWWTASWIKKNLPQTMKPTGKTSNLPYKTNKKSCKILNYWNQTLENKLQNILDSKRSTSQWPQWKLFRPQTLRLGPLEAFTPHADGRPDGWAFVGDAATRRADDFSVGLFVWRLVVLSCVKKKPVSVFFVCFLCTVY